MPSRRSGFGYIVHNKSNSTYVSNEKKKGSRSTASSSNTTNHASDHHNNTTSCHRIRPLLLSAAFVLLLLLGILLRVAPSSAAAADAAATFGGPIMSTPPTAIVTAAAAAAAAPIFSLLVTLTFTAAEHQATFWRDIAPLIQYVREHERDTTLCYRVLRSDQNALRVLILERYRDRDHAFVQVHRTSAPFLAFRPKLQALQDAGHVVAHGESYVDDDGTSAAATP